MDKSPVRKCQSRSLPQKLLYRQLFGNDKTIAMTTPCRFFEKCPDNFQIPLKKILDHEVIKKGHVSVGFTSDGKYLMSYECHLQFQLDSDPVLYKYTLQWWLFDLWNPLRKVHEVELFGEENIRNELHILLCQPPYCNYFVVHGSTYSIDALSSGKMSYLSVVPTAETTMLHHCLHLRYELLPPHPPFVSSVCLKLKNVILLNSGDMLFAILLSDKKLFNASVGAENQIFGRPHCYCSNAKRKESLRYTATDRGCLDSVKVSEVSSSVLKNSENVNTQLSDTENSYDCASSINWQTDSKMETLNIQKDNPVFENNPSTSTPIESSAVVTDYVSFVMQGYSIPDDRESQESLPASPFDCTATVMPSNISSSDGLEVLKHTYEHRCFKSRNKGSHENCDYFICQAQFDAENFVNEEIQLCDDISARFVSVRDYDMQIVDVCQETNEVIILINALIVLRDKVQRNHDHNCGRSHDSKHKLVLYTLGFLISWNVNSGVVKVLKMYPLVEGPGTLCKTRQFSPSLAQTVQIRKNWFVPTAKVSAVQSLSNHTIFFGRSLQYLFHPLLPVALVK